MKYLRGLRENFEFFQIRFFFCGGDYVKRIIHIHAFVVLLRQQVDETLRCAFHSIFLCENIVYRSNNVLVMSWLHQRRTVSKSTQPKIPRQMKSLICQNKNES